VHSTNRQWLLNRYRRSRFRSRGVLLLAAAAGVVAFAIAGFLAFAHRSSAARPATYQILTSAKTPLPRGSVPSFLATLKVDPVTGSHLVREAGGTQYFAVASSDNICLIIRRPETTASTCAGLKELKSDDLVYLRHALPKRRMDLWGLVPDGVESATVGATRFDIADNLLVAEGIPMSGSVTLSGPLVNRTLDLGLPTPDGVTIAPDPT
jgi:hypothetical protein